MNFIYRIYEMICRMCYWGWHMRNSYDWDYAYLYQTINLKMRRMDVCFKNGYHEWTKNDGRMYKRFKEAMELSKRLSNGGSNYYLYQISIEKVLNCFKITKEEDELFRIAILKDDLINKANKARFWEIMENDIEHWWE